MRLTLQRVVEMPEATLGVLSVDGTPLCWSLEDQAQPGGKVPGETRIPSGVYAVRLYTAGRLYSTYARRWPWHRGMLELQDVPGFTCVLIHPGNDDDDTRGCLLPGLRAQIQPPRLVESRGAYERIYRATVVAAAHDDLEVAVWNPAPPPRAPAVEPRRRV